MQAFAPAAPTKTLEKGALWEPSTLFEGRKGGITLVSFFKNSTHVSNLIIWKLLHCFRWCRFFGDKARRKIPGRGKIDACVVAAVGSRNLSVRGYLSRGTECWHPMYVPGLIGKWETKRKRGTEKKKEQTKKQKKRPKKNEERKHEERKDKTKSEKIWTTTIR